MAATTEKQERFHFLDGLRGIASFMILMHHSVTSAIRGALHSIGLPVIGDYFAWFTQSGVELFFVLSGVVLLRPFLRGQRKFNVLNYFYRRIKRIYPPYWAALLFSAGVSWYIYAYPTWYTNAVWHLFFLWKEVLKESVIINFDGGYYNLAWWSLSVELLFYIIVPVIIFIFPKQYKVNNTNVIVSIIVTLALSVALELWLTAYHHEIYDFRHLKVNVYQFICYPVCFLMGVFLAARDFTPREAYVMLSCGLILVLASHFYLPVVNPGYGLVYAGIVTLSFTEGTFRRFLSHPLMIWFGERSYSLFLIHFAVFYLTDNIVAQFVGSGMLYGVLSRGIGIPLALFMAMLLFHFVERPFARGLVTGHKFWPWQARSIEL